MAAKKKSIEVSLITEKTAIIGCFDLHRMEQVVVNVLSNAIKYTQEGGKVHVHVFEEDGYGIIRVKDNGIGIPAEDINHIFDRFYRVDKARTRNLGGTGLGLSIVKEIVQGHDGKIELTSEINKGTTLRIGIPLM